jgi:ribosomal protein S27AE
MDDSAPLRQGSTSPTATGDTRTCPRCNAAMQAGRSYVAGTPLGFLAVGISLQHLWFEPVQGQRRRVVESSTLSSHIVPAFECPRCGSVLIEPSSRSTDA